MTGSVFLENPTLYSLETEVLTCAKVGHKHFGVVTKETIFSPLGDEGFINDGMVVGAYLEKDSMVHITEQYVEPGSKVTLRINEDVRKRLQHYFAGILLLEKAFWQEMRVRTTNFTIEEDSCLVSIAVPYLSSQDLSRVLDLVSFWIFEDRTIAQQCIPKERCSEVYKNYTAHVPYVHDGQGVIIDIKGVDVFPGFGVVPTSTAAIGSLVIRSKERTDSGTSLRICCSQDAMKFSNERSSLVESIVAELQVEESDVLRELQVRKATMDSLSTEYEQSFQEFLRQEVDDIDPGAPVVINFYHDLSPEKLKVFSDKAFAKFPNKIFIFFSKKNGEFHYICRGPQHSPLDMEILSGFINKFIDGTGEGSENVAHGSGAKEIAEQDLMHVCAEFLQNYKTYRPRTLHRTPHEHEQESSHT